jgi:hypothetical protein
MSINQNIIGLTYRIPLAGKILRDYVLRRRYPAEWALIHNVGQGIADHPSIMHFSVNKAATQYVKDLLGRIGRENGLVPVHLHGYSFDSDLPFFDHLSKEDMQKYAHLFRPKGYVYSVFGGAIDGIENIEKYRTVLMVRDPRDVLTSMYYSSAYSHAIPNATGDKRSIFLKRRAHTRQIDIDQFVLENAERERAIYQRYIDLYLNGRPHLYLTRYEDMVKDFSAWVDGLLDHCELVIEPAMRTKIVEEAGLIRPVKENKYAHIRKGEPGDHHDKLQPKTVLRLNDIFAEVMKKFGYV